MANEWVRSTQVSDERGQLLHVFVGDESLEEENYIIDPDAKRTRKDENGHSFADQLTRKFLVQFTKVTRKEKAMFGVDITHQRCRF